MAPLADFFVTGSFVEFQYADGVAVSRYCVPPTHVAYGEEPEAVHGTDRARRRGLASQPAAPLSPEATKDVDSLRRRLRPDVRVEGRVDVAEVALAGAVGQGQDVREVVVHGVEGGEVDAVRRERRLRDDEQDLRGRRDAARPLDVEVGLDLVAVDPRVRAVQDDLRVVGGQAEVLTGRSACPRG